MFAKLAARVPKDTDLPDRAWRVEVLHRVLDGTIYDVLPDAFDDERSPSGEYIRLRDRRPSVRYNLCRIVVTDAVGLLFGEGRFPEIEAEDEASRKGLAEIAKHSRLKDAMAEAALLGSVGSVAVIMRILKGRVFWDVMRATYLTPTFDPEAPDTLAKLTERRKVLGKDLEAVGYTVPRADQNVPFWFQREWTAEAEIWFHPLKVSEQDAEPRPDDSKTTRHGLGFVPAVWIVNLPGGDTPDGACTFAAAIDTQMEIEAQLSQAGRGLKYSSDPTLLIKEPASEDGALIKGGGNAIIVSEKGDAKLLEIGGTAATAVIEYARALRQFAMVAISGNRADPDKFASAQSGRAMEMLYAPLIGLADRLRASYGENALLRLLRMVVDASAKFPIAVQDRQLRNLNGAGLALRWPNGWFAPTEEDNATQAATLATLRTSGHISRETSVKTIAPRYDIENVETEIAAIEADEAAADTREVAKAAQVRATETSPG